MSHKPLGVFMTIKVNGQDMKDAVLKGEVFEMRLLELTANAMKITVQDTYGEPFNFVPRFIDVAYPNGQMVPARDSGIIVVGPHETVNATIEFREKLRLDPGVTFQLRYARRKLADIRVE